MLSSAGSLGAELGSPAITMICLPKAREGHASALVNDVMYVFGGRTDEGVDLGDLSAFRMSTSVESKCGKLTGLPSPLLHPCDLRTHTSHRLPKQRTWETCQLSAFRLDAGTPSKTWALRLPRDLVTA
jgi:hypothetical protein